MDGLCLVGRLGDARKLFDSMAMKGHKPNVISYNVLINGYYKNQKMEVAMNCYWKVIHKKFRPTLVMYCILITCLFMAGKVEYAQKLLEAM